MAPVHREKELGGASSEWNSISLTPCVGGSPLQGAFFVFVSLGFEEPRYRCNVSLRRLTDPLLFIPCPWPFFKHLYVLEKRNKPALIEP
jgi:hypothetical protein